MHPSPGSVHFSYHEVHRAMMSKSTPGLQGGSLVAKCQVLDSASYRRGCSTSDRLLSMQNDIFMIQIALMLR
jgi:hypothetical protein